MTMLDPVMTNYRHLIDYNVDAVLHDDYFMSDIPKPAFTPSPFVDDFKFKGFHRLTPIRTTCGFCGVNLRDRVSARFNDAQDDISAQLYAHARTYATVYQKLTTIVNTIRVVDETLNADLDHLRVRMTADEFTSMLIKRLIAYFISMHSMAIEEDGIMFVFTIPVPEILAHHCGFFHVHCVRFTADIKVVELVFDSIVDATAAWKPVGSTYPDCYTPSTVAFFNIINGDTFMFGVNKHETYSEELSRKSIKQTKFVCDHWNTIYQLRDNQQYILETVTESYAQSLPKDGYFQHIHHEDGVAHHRTIEARSPKGAKHLATINEHAILVEAFVSAIAQDGVPVACERVDKDDFDTNECQLCCDSVACYRCSRCHYPFCTECVRKQLGVVRKCPCCNADGGDFKLIETTNVTADVSVAGKTLTASNITEDDLRSFDPLDTCAYLESLMDYHQHFTNMPHYHGLLTAILSRKFCVVEVAL